MEGAWCNLFKCRRGGGGKASSRNFIEDLGWMTLFYMTTNVGEISRFFNWYSTQFGNESGAGTVGAWVETNVKVTANGHWNMQRS
jgi:hypothetical protein